MDKPLYIRRSSCVYFDGSDDDQQPDLRELAHAVCHQRYRRIDRYTQLALLGAGRCAAELTLDPQTAVYLASGKGPAMNNIQMQQAIFRDNTPPMPIQFINAVSNAVSFYVMQEHALQGQNLFVSRETHAFESALTLAAVDIQSGRVPAALLGMVDELTHPLDHQRNRLNVPADTALGEGSHWLLLDAKPSAETIATIEQCRLFDSVYALQQWLDGFAPDLSVFIYFGMGVDDAMRDQCLRRLAEVRVFSDQPENLWDGLNAGALVRFVQQPPSEGEERLLTISRDRDDRCQATVVRRSPSGETTGS